MEITLKTLRRPTSHLWVPALSCTALRSPIASDGPQRGEPGCKGGLPTGLSISYIPKNVLMGQTLKALGANFLPQLPCPSYLEPFPVREKPPGAQKKVSPP